MVCESFAALPHAASSGPFIVGKYHQTQKPAARVWPCRLWLTGSVGNRLQACQQSLTGGVGDGLHGRTHSKLYGPHGLCQRLWLHCLLKRTGFWLRLTSELSGAPCLYAGIARLPNFRERSRARTARKTSRACMRWVAFTGTILPEVSGHLGYGFLHQWWNTAHFSAASPAIWFSGFFRFQP